MTRDPRARRRRPDMRLSPHQRQRLLRRRGPSGAADPGGQAGERSPAGPVRPRPGPGLVQPRAVRRAHRQRPARPAGGLVPAGGGAEQRQPHPHRSDRHPARGRLLGRPSSSSRRRRARPPTTSTPRAASPGSTTRGPSSSTSTCFRLRHGAASLPRFETQARTLGGLSGTDLDALATSIATSIDPQAVGWWILTGLAALVGIIVLAQALARQAAMEADDYPVLGALGATRRQLFTLTMARTLVVALAGAAGGVLLAALLSFFVPVGEARLADPAPGFDFDALLLIGGAAVAVVAVLALGVWPAVRASRLVSRRDDDPVVRSSRVVAFLTGVRRPPERPHRDPQRPGAGTRPHRRAGQLGPRRRGPGGGGALRHRRVRGEPDPPDQHTRAVRPGRSTRGSRSTARVRWRRTIDCSTTWSDPASAAITAGVGGDVSINGHVVDALAGQSLRGPYLITTIDGRPADSRRRGRAGREDHAPGGRPRRLDGTRRTVEIVVGRCGRRRSAVSGWWGPPCCRPTSTAAALGTGAVFTLDGLAGTGLSERRRKSRLPLRVARRRVRRLPRSHHTGAAGYGGPGRPQPGLPVAR